VPQRKNLKDTLMQSRFLNARIESTLLLAVSALSVAVIGIGTAGMVRSFDPTPEVAVAAPLERVVITGTRKAARLAQASAPALPAAGTQASF
jgi:hypothetical protein